MTKHFKVILIILLFCIAIISFLIYENIFEKKYVLKEFYANGKLKGINEYKIKNCDTVFDGKFINYNNKGNVTSEGQFLNNEPFGYCTYYYENGIKESKHYRKNSNITLESFFYSKRGLLSRYVVSDTNDVPFYVIQYDKIGVTRSSGLLQVELFQHELDKHLYNKEKFVKYTQKKNEHKVGGKINCRFIYPNIPNSKKSYSIEIENSINKYKLKNIKYSKPFFYDLEEKFCVKGRNTIQSIVRYKFNDNVTPMFIDTLKFDIYVK
ncbi:toxin-antitoxin system YwqK family antitoxin [Flavobacterium oreochromis]|uniref:MORN repeat variant n=1 Tax=Flavobacterium columnare TaxID=996 RepID=A0A246G734_9FLAO|nr:hypothetical protein [Flavobacterium oreochromis]OWP74086.1 hypothetical protein BWK62_15085 [Flavobacterium oreochromis]